MTTVDLRRLAKQAILAGGWPFPPDPQTILALLDERDHAVAAVADSLALVGMIRAAERRVAALEAALALIQREANAEGSWQFVRAKATEARALLASPSEPIVPMTVPEYLQHAGMPMPDPAALPAEVGE